MGKQADRGRLHFLWALVLVVSGGCDGCFGCGGGDDDGCNFGGGIGCDIGDDSCFLGGCEDVCSCPDGATCNSFGECEDIITPPIDPCEDSETVCGSACCAGDQVCWFDTCMAPGQSCASAADCTETEICSYDHAAADIDTDICFEPLSGACMPSPNVCFGGAMPGCRPICQLTDLDVASAATDPGALWGDPNALDAADSVISPPAVVQLDDDDCDQVVDWRDAPDILFMTATAAAGAGHGRLVATTMDHGVLVEKWSDAPLASRNDPSTQIASARLDGEAYVIVCTEDDRLRAYDHLGAERWLSDPLLACDAPTVGNLGGTASVVTEGGIVSLATGAVTVPFASALSGPPLIADVHGATLGNEIVTPQSVLRADGTAIADTSRPGSFVVVADLDGDAAPEMITVESGSGQHEMVIWQLDATGSPVIVRADVDTHGALIDGCLPADPGADRSGGPPTIADFTGDGTLDVAVAGARGVVVFDGTALMNPVLTEDLTVLMEIPLSDCADGRRGLTAFDFDHDGISELVARDSMSVHIVSTLSAGVTWSACNPTEPGFGITPIVDVDRNGSADLLGFASARSGAMCNGALHSGVGVFAHQDAGWAGAPRVWPQHIDLAPDLRADGTIGDLVSPWTEFIPPGVHAAPATNEAANLRLTVRSQCSLVMQVEVENLGVTPVPAGAASIRLYGSVGTLSVEIAIIPVPVSLEAGAAVLVEHQIDVAAWSGLSAVVEYEPGSAVHECRTNDNQASANCKD